MPRLTPEALHEKITPLLKRLCVPGAAVAVMSSDGALLLPLGEKVDGGGDAVGPATTFQIASLSKAYTATVFARLVDRSALSWDDKVTSHLPEFRLYDACATQMATVRDLLTMRLGLKGEGLMYWGRNTELGVDVLLNRFHHFEPAAGFREAFTYSNPAYTLLAEIAQRKLGKPFGEILREEIFAPLGMQDSFMQEGVLIGERDNAYPHVFIDDKIKAIGSARCGGRMGESCIYSSARDAEKWLAFHLGFAGRELVSSKAMAELHRPQTLSAPALGHTFIAYCMGWQARDTPLGPIYLHDGGEFGVASFTVFNPKQRAGVTVYLNVARAAAARAIGYTMLDLLIGQSGDDRVATSLDHERQENEAMQAMVAQHFSPSDGADLREDEIVGRYFNPLNGVFVIERVGDALQVKALDGWVFDASLTALGGGVYEGECHFLGMHALARKINRVRFVKDDEGVAIHTLGLGVLRKVSGGG